MNHLLLLLMVILLQVPDAFTQLNRFKSTKSRASSKLSLNPFKPFMKFVRDPLKASAQRQYPKYLPPPPNMYASQQVQQHNPTLHRISTMASMNWPRYYSPPVKVLPPSTISIVPQMTSLPSSLVFSALAADRNHYKPITYPAMNALTSLPSDIQIKTLRIPSRYVTHKKQNVSPANLNLADSVVRQLLDFPNQDNMPSVLVIEEPDVSSASTSASQNSDVYADINQKPTIFVAPPITASGDLGDSSADMSLSNAGNSNPDVFVIVSKNSKHRGLFSTEEKKNDILSSGSSMPKMKKYKITTSMDDYGNPTGSRQVWIIKR